MAIALIWMTGTPTAQCLYSYRTVMDQAEVLASGGIRHPLDMVKAWSISWRDYPAFFLRW